MNEQLKAQTSYLVMVGNRFIGEIEPVIIKKDVKDAKEFGYETAKEIAKELNSVVVRKTEEYEMVECKP
ncbi:hypothetical protein [Bacillus thuringiensis]|uniref:hypothetical protein n=1 Tax=Bacillus thuringiensis TaxID=1428 RepID=UPI0026E1E146|nr:hypothetical protein [Bacillus thuringiensis]MDO6631790.1 hypothetical protein [Bacillus thuringiensis]MDO6661379.1 hypothetical protein [Bacillus thuringiensis]MDO6701930.1 hypothetical protein [Bacillus thuringiensis]